MKYQNKSPEEIARGYRRGLRMKQGLILLAFLLYFVGIFWRRDAGIAAVLFHLLLFALVSFLLNVWISLDFMSLNLILNQNCDPVTFLQVMRLLEKKRNNRRNALIIRINEAAGLMWSGQFRQALSLAESLPAPKEGSYQISLLNIRFNCRMKLEDQDGARLIQQEAEAMVPTLKRAAMRKWGRRLLEVMNARFALRQKDYDTFRRITEAQSAGYTANIQRVVAAVCLAEADMAQGELGNARNRLEYAIQAGGTVYMVEDARQMLAELERREQGHAGTVL